MHAADWEPYLPTPPFPAYVSGHSAFTAAWARAMELAIGKPDFNFKTTVRHLYVEQRELAEPVTLSYPTFAAAAEAAGISRIWAGFTGRRTTSAASSSAARSARASGGALSNSCSARRPRPRPYSRRCVRLSGSTTMPPPTAQSVLTPLRASRSTYRLRQRALGEASWSVRC